MCKQIDPYVIYGFASYQPLRPDEMLHADLEYSTKIQGLDCIYSGAVPLFTKLRVFATFDSESPTI